MKKVLLTFCLFLSTSLLLLGQTDTLGNQWYKNLLATNPNRPFVKLVTWREGIYHLDIADLTQMATGYDFTQIDAKTLQLYYRGKKVPMYVFPEQSSTFSYIEFVGKQNDGWVDSLMYFEPSSGLPVASGKDLRPNKFVSLYTDSAAFFLTWESAGGTLGTRYTFTFDNTYSSLTPMTSFPFEVTYIPGTQNPAFKEDNLISKFYSPGGGSAYNLEHVLNSDYTTGEGWLGSSNVVDFGNSENSPPRIASIKLKTLYPVSGSSYAFATRVFGKSETAHHLKISLNNTAILDSVINSNPKIYIGNFSRTLTTGISDSIIVKYEAVFNTTDNNSVCWSSILYDRDPSKGMDSWVRWKIPKLVSPPGQKTLLTIPKVRGGQSILAFDVNNNLLIKGTLDLNTPTNRRMQLILPPASSNPTRQLVIATDSGLLKPVVYKSHLAKLHAAGTNGAKMIILTHRAFTDAATKYKAYRDTTLVNPIPTQIVYVDDIYDEYGYGSETPWAIKRFCHEALTKWPTKPDYFLIMGKAVHTADNRNTVLSVCDPVSDREFVSHFNPSANIDLDIQLRAAIGRITASTNQEALDYLDKVKQHEHTPWQPWMKRGIFLGGGASAIEVQTIETTMIHDQKVFEAYPFGGNAYRYQKKSNDPLDPSASYHQSISDGACWIHFFGHSASQLVDVSLKDPSQYSNYGRYPVMLAMGCYVGRFNQATSLGQNWITQQGRGAIAYIGNSGPGFPTPLSDYSRTGHNYVWNYMLGERLGDAMTAYHNKYIDSLGGNYISTRNHIRQLNLQGDPSIRINTPPGIDLAITNSDVYFTPDNFSALDDSFKINIIVKNLGLISKDDFKVSIRQQLPNNTWYNHPSQNMLLLTYQDTLSFYLKNPVGNDMAGLNTFEIYVDSTNAITEYNENNNFISLAKLVPGNIPACLFPIEFAVIDQAKPSLIASGYSMTRDSTVKYIFEMDTTYDFSSPFIQVSPLITAKSMLASWQLPVTLPDSAVCYWRVRLADVTPTIWAYSTFRYIKNKVGWAQARIPQFTKDSKNQIKSNIIQNQWEFDNITNKYQFEAIDGGSFSVSVNEGKYCNGASFSSNLNGVAFMILDQKTLENKTSSALFSNTVDFAYSPNPSGSTGDLQLLINAIQSANNGDYIYLTSNFNAYTALWPSYIFDYLESQGVSPALRVLPNGKSFIVFGRKGSPNSMKTIFANATGIIDFEASLSISLNAGNVKSTLIGPSKGWDRLIWNWNTIDVQNKETLDVSVFGVKSDGTEQFMFTTNGTGTYMLDTISQVTYPFMYLRAAFKDAVYLTAPQLKHWHVLYDQAPDALVYPFDNFYFKNDTLSEGGNIEMRISALNPTKIDMDSLLVNFSIERADRSQALSITKRFAKLPHNASIPITFSVPSVGLNLDGKAKFIVQLNPNNDQYEQYFFNNTYEHSFFVVRDRQNPLMQVTFDGKHIMDLDIVSPTPEILIELKDENKFLAADDTTSFEIYLKSPNSSSQTGERISIFNDPRVVWEKATLPNNTAKVHLSLGKLKPLEDTGTDHYKLIVQASDKRGNVAGIDNGSNNSNSYPGNGNYEITFRVVNAHTISNVLNYPNPFSTSTRFAYILTGNELPEVFKIQIYTISGKAIKTIDLVELGDMHFGKNITDYAWDGTDEFGNRLANGVYLYRVEMRMKTNTLESSKEDDKIDKYFKSGWGKMYIMR